MLVRKGSLIKCRNYAADCAFDSEETSRQRDIADNSKNVLTVYVQRNCCLVLLSVFHGTIEYDTSKAGAIVILSWRDGQCACRLVIL